MYKNFLTVSLMSLLCAGMGYGAAVEIQRRPGATQQSLSLGQVLSTKLPAKVLGLGQFPKAMAFLPFVKGNQAYKIHNEALVSLVKDMASAQSAQDARFNHVIQQAIEQKNQALILTLFEQALEKEMMLEAERLLVSLPESGVLFVEKIIYFFQRNLSEYDRWYLVPFIYGAIYSGLQSGDSFHDIINKSCRSILWAFAGSSEHNNSSHISQVKALKLKQTKAKERMIFALGLPKALGRTLKDCAAYGDERALREILKVHKHESAYYENGRTALHYAANQKQLGALNILAEFGVDLRAQDNEGSYAWNYTSSREIERWFIQKNAQQLFLEFTEKVLSEKAFAELLSVAHLEQELLQSNEKATVKKAVQAREKESASPFAKASEDRQPAAAAAAAVAATTPAGGQGAQLHVPVIFADDWQEVAKDPRFPKKGRLINGNLYTQHALIRMAASTPATRRYLIGLAKRQGYQEGTQEFNRFIETRDVPVREVEEVLQKSEPIMRDDGRYVCQYRGLKVVVGADGAVITVMRTA
jgi:hypothetical protein